MTLTDQIVKNIIISITFICITTYCLAEEVVEESIEVEEESIEVVEPKSKIGATIGAAFGHRDGSGFFGSTGGEGKGVNIFLDRTFKYGKLSLNVGYDHYDNISNYYRHIVNEIPITFGIGYGIDLSRLKSLEKYPVGLRIYCGYELGWYYREDKYIYSDGYPDFLSEYKYQNEKTTNFGLYVYYSASLVFYKTISLEANLKFRLLLDVTQYNIGLGYLF